MSLDGLDLVLFTLVDIDDAKRVKALLDKLSRSVVTESKAFQDRITEAVAGLVEPQIRRTEIERARRQWPESPLAYDHFLRALPHFYARDPAGYVLALEHLERAISLEPDYALALAYASWTYPRRSLVALKMLSGEESSRCLELASAALRHGGDDPLVMAACGHSLLAVGRRRAEGLALVKRAMEENPNSVVVLLLGGICNMAAGDLGLAQEAYTRAYTLCPGGMEAHECLAGIGFSHFLAGRHAEAIAWLERSRSSLVDWPPTFWMLAAAQAQSGHVQDARETVAKLLEIVPHTTLEGLNVLRARMDDRFQALADGLRLAGLD
jgi:tetratricopeptide (TPR) repeat protein